MSIEGVVAGRIGAVISSGRSIAAKCGPRADAIAQYLRSGAISAEEYRQISETAVSIAWQIDADPNRSIGTILKDLPARGLETQIDDLCGFMLHGENSFPVAHNIPYLALRFMVRALDKTDCHVHISNNLTNDEVSEHFPGRRIRHIGDDGFIRGTQDLSYVARESCLRFLLDGVSTFDLRFNPSKKLGDKDVEDYSLRIERNIEAVTNGANAAIEMCWELTEADINPQIGLMLSFDRKKSHEGELLFALKAGLDKRFNLSGIGVAGQEGLLESEMDKVAGKWDSVFKACRAKGFRVTSHLGDFRNARGYYAGQGISDLGEMLESYLRFVETQLKIMLPCDGLGHAYIFNPEFLISPLWDTKSYTPLSLRDAGYGEYADRIEAMIEAYDVKKFVIEHCPSAAVRNFSTVHAYSNLPLNYWMDGGFKVKIGTDAGIFSYNGPRSLSEDVTRVLLSTDYSARQILSLVGVDILPRF